ncbi:uncharacterized protein BDR25DRAFT_241117, partial [Lindgomyces ingoldianus]
TWFRCLVKRREGSVEYGWYEMTFMTCWLPDRCIMLCINTPTSMQSKLQATLSGGSLSLDVRDPFSLYVPLMDEIVKLYDLSVWGIRDLIRPIEKARKQGNYGKHFSLLEDMVRHSVHVTEVLMVALANTQDIVKYRQTLLSQAPAKSDKEELVLDKTTSYMNFQVQLLRNLKHRQQSNHDRVQTETTLAFNMTTMRDSRSMKTVAVLTMVYLPATFTSASFIPLL